MSVWPHRSQQLRSRASRDLLRSNVGDIQKGEEFLLSRVNRSLNHKVYRANHAELSKESCGVDCLLVCSRIGQKYPVTDHPCSVLERPALKSCQAGCGSACLWSSLSGGRQSQEDQEFEVSLVYIASSTPAWTKVRPYLPPQKS